MEAAGAAVREMVRWTRLLTVDEGRHGKIVDIFLNVSPIVFADGLDADCERIRRTKDNFRVFGLSNWVNGGAIY